MKTFNTIMEEFAIARNDMPDFWVKNSTLNELLREADEVRITNEGVLEICLQNDIIGITMKTELFSFDDEKCYAMVVYANSYRSSEKRPKNCVIL